ncbi:hypothetical protein [Singulisphaera sp. PoT]|uniref:hypothetical protein n=1 Tax=Singulisphaera sp. PoT TaxID=3411797 RepID=UPI003BF559C1
MRHVSIRALMGVVVSLALALAALRNADDHRAGGAIMATAAVIGLATVGAVYHDGPRRAARMGFAIFAGGYFALAFLGLSDSKLAMLPTSQLLSFFNNQTQSTYTYTIVSMPVSEPLGNKSSLLQAVPVPAPNDTSARWKALFPGSANFEAFSTIGHCLYTLTAGVLGAIIALRCEARRENRRGEAANLAGPR